MSKLAILSDIHGNLPALKAILADIAKHRIQTILCLGDVATFGPQPRETLLKIKALNCPVILGNGDFNIGNSQPVKSSSWEANISNWCKTQLYEGDRSYIQTFQPSTTLEFSGLKILAYHGSPHSFNDSITANTPDETLESYVAQFKADIFVGGHTHEQFLRHFGRGRVLNPGSVGLPL
jgi:putative phosphoesterase